MRHSVALVPTAMGSRKLVLSLALLVMVFAWAPGLSAQSVVTAAGGAPPKVSYSTRSDTTAPLRTLPQLPPLPKVLGEVFQRPRKLLPNREGSLAPASPVDPSVQSAVPQAAAPTSGPYFDGVGNVNSVLPPDPSGAVGPNHYVQMVNLSFAVWDKSGNNLMGPVSNNTLWQGFGGPCEASNDGDPVVLYDRQADRYMMSQFALPNYPRGPFYQCIAVSQGPDPTLSWHRYEFTISQSKLNDYPKFGVWQDGYYMSVNQFSCKFISCSWAGAGAVAFERAQMLTGQPARMVYFDLYTQDPDLGGMLPSDQDGATAAPPGSPNYFVQVDDDAWGYAPDQLQIWKFHVDWVNPSSSTFLLDRALTVNSFDSNLCGYARNCIPQAGTSVKVDALSDRLMYRLQYRNFGGTEKLLLNQTVDVGSDRAGIRWYELGKSSSSPWSIAQQSTYSPSDATHRWMGSIAMNGNGSVALGFSRSSSGLNPMIVATGRKSGDPSGSMTQSEITIKAGAGSQTHTSGRWGDYSQMTVDPSDDCTFWYTNEYYNAGATSAGWRTHIGSFQLGDCGGTVNQPPTASFTYSCTNLSCSFDGAGSSDPEHSALTYEWNFGDNTTASGVAAAHNYAAGGTFTVTLKVTDAGGASGSTSQWVTVSGQSSGGTMVLGPLAGSSSRQGKAKWKANVTITVQDNNNLPLANATVSGTFTPGGSVACSTGSTGQCTVTLISISNSTASVIYQVNSVTHASYPTLTFSIGEKTITVIKP